MKSRRFVLVFALSVLAPFICARAATASYQLNEKIEVNILGSWDKAVVIGVGKGDHEGEYKVHYDGYPASYDRWLRPVYFRKTAGAPAATGTKSAPAEAGGVAAKEATAEQAAIAPRTGKYTIQSFGAVGNPPLFLGHIQLLDGGNYRISRKSSGDYYGDGKYSFDAAASAVQWLSGPCKENSWGGKFTSERNDKTHKIRLTRTTIATCTVE